MNINPLRSAILSKLLPRPKFIGRRQPAGVALIVTLSLVVLLTFLIVAFFSSATAFRSTEAVSSGGVTARILGEGAVGAVRAELLEEVIAGSDLTDGVYEPKDEENMVPKRAVSSAVAANPNFANLIKQSGQEFFSGATIFPNASDNSADAAESANGRRVGESRWDAPMLTGANFTADETPNWVYVTPDGYSATATDETIGRVAFNVYDIGGLLNANAAGFAPGAGGVAFSEEMHRKGSTVWADLRELPGIAPNSFGNSDSWLPTWRVTGDWGSGVNGFSMYAPGSSFGYYERTGWRFPYLIQGAGASDRMLSSRQDLIRYAKANPAAFPPSGTLLPALQYLTHWSRWTNAPSFKHDTTRTYTKPVAGGVTAGGNDYSSVAAQEAANPFFPTVRVTVPFQRKTVDPDGNLIDRSETEGFAKEDEPLVKYRFPLTRLGLVQRTADAVGEDSPIFWAFGLTKEGGISSPWIYSALKPSNDRIYTLAEVADLGREPNFFELLKAAIHVGSLGKASGAGAIVERDALDGNLDIQVLRLGANLMDQFDADSFPTIIRLPASSALDDSNYLGSGTRKVKIYGIENLPQVQGVTQVWKWTSAQNLSSSPTGGTIIMQPVLWNPHDITTYADPSSSAPTKFRVWASATSLQYLSVPASTTNPNRGNSAVEFDASSSAFREPNLIARGSRDGINASALGPLASIRDDTNFTWLGSGRTEPAGGLATPGAAGIYAANSANGLSVYLDYQDADGEWVTYSALESVIHNGFVNGYTGYVSYFAKPDPRTQRFGSFASQTGATNTTLNAAGAWNHIGTGFPPVSGQMASLWDAPPRGPVVGVAGWGQFSGRGSAGAGERPTGITLNTQGAPFRYTDPDGVLRWGDSGFGANGMLSNEQATRPIVLNRPFRSVGEMGYAFRDLPWKSIDFFSERSGDSALLDVFCISESPDDALVAGRVSLNSASDEVLVAMLKAALRRDGGGAGPSGSPDHLTTAEITTLVDAIRSVRTANPFLNRNELVMRVMSALPSSGTSFTIKRQREAVIRALADVVETRNWNIMIDLISQSGKVRGGGAFIPEGESRLWQFVSIDRMTARVVDESSETLME